MCRQNNTVGFVILRTSIYICANVPVHAGTSRRVARSQSMNHCRVAPLSVHPLSINQASTISSSLSQFVIGNAPLGDASLHLVILSPANCRLRICNLVLTRHQTKVVKEGYKLTCPSLLRRLSLMKANSLLIRSMIDALAG